MKLLLITIVLCLFISCEVKKTDASNSPSKEVNTSYTENDCVPKISVTTVLVSKSSAFGYVGKGSCIYSPNESQKGYAVQLKYCDKIVTTYYCPISELAHYIDLIRYEVSVKDSVVFKFPIK